MYKVIFFTNTEIKYKDNKQINIVRERKIKLRREIKIWDKIYIV